MNFLLEVTSVRYFLGSRISPEFISAISEIVLISGPGADFLRLTQFLRKAER